MPQHDLSDLERSQVHESRHVGGHGKEKVKVILRHLHFAAGRAKESPVRRTGVSAEFVGLLEEDLGPVMHGCDALARIGEFYAGHGKDVAEFDLLEAAGNSVSHCP